MTRSGYCPYCKIRKLSKRINVKTCGRDICRIEHNKIQNRLRWEAMRQAYEEKKGCKK